MGSMFEPFFENEEQANIKCKVKCKKGCIKSGKLHTTFQFANQQHSSASKAKYYILMTWGLAGVIAAVSSSSMSDLNG